MTTPTHYTAVAVFTDALQAERAVVDLRQRGFRDEQIGVVRGPLGTEPDSTTAHTVAEGTGLGVVAGASLGSLLAGVGGPGGAAVGGLLAGALEGGLVGGLLGSLLSLGVPEEEARYYQRELQAGHTILAVNADGRFAEAMAVLAQHGGRTAESPLSQVGPGILP